MPRIERLEDGRFAVDDLAFRQIISGLRALVNTNSAMIYESDVLIEMERALKDTPDE